MNQIEALFIKCTSKKRIVKIAICFFLLLLSFSFAFSQEKQQLIIQLKDTSTVKIKKSIRFKDTLSVKKYMNRKIEQLQRKGYLLAAIDSISKSPDQSTYWVYIGPQFKNIQLKISSDDSRFLRKKSRLSEKSLTHLPFSPNEVVNVKQLVFQTLENNGYPFASVRIDSIEISSNQLTGKLLIEKGSLVKISKINVIGDDKVPTKLIRSYIQIKEGDLFNQEALNLISGRISLLPFIEEVKPTEILFTPWGVELYLYLRNKKISSADGIVGLQPKTNGKGYFLTGELHLKLINQLKHAESFSLQWKSIQKQTQSLDVKINLPNLFKSRFGFDGTFNLFKRDTTFMDLHFQIGVQYALNNGSYLKFYYRNENSSILSSGLSNSDFTHLNTSKTNYYGFNLIKQTIDYLPNPTKGYFLSADISIGLRKTKHPDSTAFQKSTTYKLKVDYHHFFTLHKRNVLRIGWIGNYFIAPTYFENELFRFGGQFIQRGFNEEQLLASVYSTISVEYRFLVDRNSYAFAFFDQSVYQNKVNNYTDFPFGFGAGFTFGTKIGSFSISYALGKQKNTTLRLKDGKVHFGYIAYF